MKLSLKVPKNFKIIAHRGASGYAPENTLVAFKLAERMGVAEVELDVWYSKDKHVFIISKYDGILIEVQKQAKFARCGWILTPGSFNEKSIERAAAAEFFQACPKVDEVNRDIVAAALVHLAEVRAYGVKGIADVLSAVVSNCVGLTINWPDWLKHGD